MLAICHCNENLKCLKEATFDDVMLKSGTLPGAWANLPLQNLDLSQNALNGSLPSSWGMGGLLNATMGSLDLSENQLSVG